KAVATEALRALLAGPPSGYQTALPPDLKVVRVAIRDRLATLTLSRRLAGRTHRAEAQIVYTLTQFPTVRRVEIAGGTGKPLGPVTRADYVDVTQAAP